MSGNAPNLPQGHEHCSATDGCFAIVLGGGDCGAIHCPACGQAIAVSEDENGIVVECGSVGDGACDACFDLTNPAMVRACSEAQDKAEEAYWAANDPDVLSLLSDETA